MNRTQTIGMFAGIFAIAIGAITLSGDSNSSFMVSAVPQTQDKIGMLGHVEYTVSDELNQIKAYKQTDNIVTLEGLDCVGDRLFNTATTADCGTSAAFEYVAIGNFTETGVPVNTKTDALDLGSTDTGSDGCADTGTFATEGGEMARKQVSPTLDSTGSNAIITLDTSATPFTFTSSNATTVFQSGLFNAAATLDGNGQCSDATSAGDMFAYQDLNLDAGIDVTAGDSLSVKWTITVS